MDDKSHAYRCERCSTIEMHQFAPNARVRAPHPDNPDELVEAVWLGPACCDDQLMAYLGRLTNGGD